MKNWIYLAACTLIVIGSGARATEVNDATVDQILKAVNSKGLVSLENLLPLLPKELRSNFTLVHESQSLQEATFAEPRVVMFGKDGKFLAAFNSGDPKLKGSNTLEMISFNELESKFDFFRLTFPGAADPTVKTVQFEANPAVCKTCHGVDLHPNWPSYNNWPGMYGTSDDFMEGDELASYQSFMASRQQNARYKELVPLVGSDLAPFSFEKRGDFKFRPNLRMGQFVSRFEAKNIARLIRQSGKLDQYAPLIAYELDRNGAGGSGYPECAPLNTQTSIYGGAWTADNAAKLLARLEKERLATAPTLPPIPAKWNLVKDLYPLFSGQGPGDWGLTKEPVAEITEFGNGSNPLRSYVVSELLNDIYKTIPELKPYAVMRSRLVEDTPNQRLVRTPFDVEFEKIIDKQSMRVSFKSPGKSDGQAHCLLLLDRIKRTWQ